jgi:hypothetical protein
MRTIESVTRKEFMDIKIDNKYANRQNLHIFAPDHQNYSKFRKLGSFIS